MAKRVSDSDDMTPAQALILASLLIDFELEQPAVKPAPPEWEEELQAARAVLNGMIARAAPPPAWVTKPVEAQASNLNIPREKRSGRDKAYDEKPAKNGQ